MPGYFCFILFHCFFHEYQTAALKGVYVEHAFVSELSDTNVTAVNFLPDNTAGLICDTSVTAQLYPLPDIIFSGNSDIPDLNDSLALIWMLDILGHYPDAKIHLNGIICNANYDDHPNEITTRRVNVIVDYFLSNGINRQRIVIEFSPSEPINYSIDYAPGHFRRVECALYNSNR